MNGLGASGVLEWLVARGANLGAQGPDALHAAANGGHADAARYGAVRSPFWKQRPGSQRSSRRVSELLTDQRGAPRQGRCDIGAYEHP